MCDSNRFPYLHFICFKSWIIIIIKRFVLEEASSSNNLPLEGVLMSWIMNYIFNLAVTIPTEESNQDITSYLGSGVKTSTVKPKSPTLKRLGVLVIAAGGGSMMTNQNDRGQGNRSWFPLADKQGTKMYDPNNLCLLWNKMKSARQEVEWL